MKQSRHLWRADPFLGAFIRKVLQPTVLRGSSERSSRVWRREHAEPPVLRAASSLGGFEASQAASAHTQNHAKIKTSGGKQRIRERPEILSGDIEALISVISLSSNSSVPYTNYSCQQLNVFIPFCLLYYSTFILLFSPHLFTRIKAYSDRIIPLHNKNKSQRLHTHHSHSKSTAKL